MRTKFLAVAALVSLACLPTSSANADTVGAAMKFWQIIIYSRPVVLRLGSSLNRQVRAYGAQSRLLPYREPLTREDVKVIATQLRPFTKEDHVEIADDAVTAVTHGSDLSKSAQLLKFNVLDGKLKVGSLKKFPGIEIEGGEVNVYKAAAAGSAAAYCGATACFKAAGGLLANELLKVNELIDMVETVSKAKQP
ncbi:hypothetical protein ACVWW4_000872 [Bradyrhizobium sp. LB7.1]